MPKTQLKKDAPQVKCPTCGINVVWDEAFPQRPFCSERCKNNDFVDWANEEHRIAGSTDFDDILSESLSQEQAYKLH